MRHFALSFMRFSMKKFVVVVDDIVVYSQTLKEHLSHLCTVFERLRENYFYVKLEKCSFAQHEILFLGPAGEALYAWTRRRSVLSLSGRHRAAIILLASQFLPPFLKGVLEKAYTTDRSVEKGPGLRRAKQLSTTSSVQ